MQPLPHALLASLACVALGACSDNPALAPTDAAPADASVDAPTDAPSDAPNDARFDAAPDVVRDSRGVFLPSSYPVDGRFREEEWNQVGRMGAWRPIPVNPTNRYGDTPRAAALGERFFRDLGFSANGRVGCITCHDPARAFTDGRPVAEALARGTRNTPSLRYLGWTRFVMWDGAADSLWSQPIMAVENPREHGFTRLALAHRVATLYRDAYEELFGPLPPLDDTTRFPPSGMPGEAAWEAMTERDRTAVNRIAANFGKSLEAFERALPTPRGAFDRYAAGDFNALSPTARDGLALFIRVGCVHCHNGPLFTDNDFHTIRAPDDPIGGPDHGRLTGTPRLLASPFNANGAFSDARDERLAMLTTDPTDDGRFRTPTLRGIAQTAPYTHAGTLPTLESVIRSDAHQGLPPGDPRAQGTVKDDLLPMQSLTDAEVRALVEFLQTLTPE